MTGAFMLIAFILGFWCIWSANREVNSIGEALGFTLLAIILKGLMEWSGMPHFDKTLMAIWGILFVFTVIVFELVERLSSNISANMGVALVGAGGWFGIAKWAFSTAGMTKIASWVI
ncbi:phosphate transporter [Kingella negevensis]|uniref:phosphate transporter n=1 Tax=Kingella negevensis TaxID=1522312 RepID=UPI00254310D4|nr:phosphate transporter [Kingella negevensis]MDK4684745.1 phosphate transporter [Kingella negevensis]MDK4708627.1 phosphate transporter [Kingella negevensis]MDK4710400.1 phosphate transporter [Kingella negevensis]WII92765.1 phosphate transporter [Kingella negevensis]